MASYTVQFARSARKELERLEGSLVARILPKIESLAENPRPRGTRKLRGREGLRRLRVGSYRVVYDVDDEQQIVDIVAIRHRSEAYQ